MTIPQVSTAFCGKSLRTASLIIAWFSTIFVGIIWSLYLSLLPTLFNAFGHIKDVPGQMLASISGMILTYFIIEHCLLLWGVIKKRHYFLLPWIVMTCLFIAFGACFTVILLIMVFLLSPIAFIFFLFNSLIISALIYCLVVIFSYYQEVSKENSRNENSAI
ncbi:uncharacterized protein [Halyomorpha halys]|uniref:uncharacterized protein n=1 Tax=Halyomorpha halys TaxID=286706 RepID=UPI0006D514A4|nr:uncharacterized protein LOC106690613 [Halyomorpha halys]XP_024217800.1 uncharacterized protein LOC106690613 [Halyomorpha halys]XP_024217801.1 uncharacterized protein LOC106690613 [Halyomorpha halys]XP_024217802.1 uncharacterized protein LOC106690613 [Halyomorpha halys]